MLLEPQVQYLHHLHLCHYSFLHVMNRLLSGWLTLTLVCMLRFFISPLWKAWGTHVKLNQSLDVIVYCVHATITTIWHCMVEWVEFTSGKRILTSKPGTQYMPELCHVAIVRSRRVNPLRSFMFASFASFLRPRVNSTYGVPFVSIFQNAAPPWCWHKHL